MPKAPDREHPIVNPERCVAALRRLVLAWGFPEDEPKWDQEKQAEFFKTIDEARRLLSLPVTGSRGAG